MLMRFLPWPNRLGKSEPRFFISPEAHWPLITEAQMGNNRKSCQSFGIPRRPHPTNLDIQKWVALQHGFVPETAWIEHCKHVFGLKSVFSDSSTTNHCPADHP